MKLVSKIHHQQINPGACVPTCIAMVFSKYKPVDKTQVYDWITELYEYLETDSVEGTQITRLAKTVLTRWGFKLETKQSDLKELRKEMRQGFPIICIIESRFLPYSKRNMLHTVVVVGVGTKYVYLNDPLISEDKIVRLPKTTFLEAWSGWGFNQTIKIEPL